MTDPVPTIDHATLERLVETGAVRDAEVIGGTSGWGVVVKQGRTRRTLAARRGAARTFRKFETLVTYLQGLGIFQYRVDAQDFDPTSLKATRVRPDSAERMREAFAAKDHADWMQRKVAQSLADPSPNRSHQQVMTDAQAMIDKAKRARKART